MVQKSLQLTITNVTFRPVTSGDSNVLYNIYCSTRASEMAMMTDWTNFQKDAFLKLQFDAQQHYYLQHYKGADFWMIEKKKKSIGRFYLHQKYDDDSIRIIDITLLPEFRNKGIGRQILSAIISFATERKQAVTLHVQTTNPAIGLYKKLGFKPIHTTNMHCFMQWTPEGIE